MTLEHILTLAQIVLMIVMMAAVVIASRTAVMGFSAQIVSLTGIVEDLRKVVTALSIEVAILKDRSGHHADNER